MQTEFQPEQLVWYFLENKVHSAPIQSVMTVQNSHEDWAHTKEQKELFTRFGPAGTFIATVHTTLPVDKVFSSKEELVASLLEK
jgi:hypothetical protein